MKQNNNKLKKYHP